MFTVLMSIYYKENSNYLVQSLESVLHQTVTPNEIILVEDGPLTNELNEIIDTYKEKYKILKVVPLEKNRGLGTALNEGLKYCSNELVARMDTDDIAKPNRFEKQLAVFQNNPEIDICSSWIDEFEESMTNVISKRTVPEYHSQISKYARTRCPINHPAVMYKKSKVLMAGGYYGFPEDYNLWARMLLSGSKFYNIQESLVLFRFSSEVIKRRGGWKYAKSEIRSQVNFYRIGFINIRTLAINISIRVLARLFPSNLRGLIYKTLRR